MSVRQKTGREQGLQTLILLSLQLIKGSGSQLPRLKTPLPSKLNINNLLRSWSQDLLCKIKFVAPKILH